MPGRKLKLITGWNSNPTYSSNSVDVNGDIGVSGNTAVSIGDVTAGNDATAAIAIPINQNGGEVNVISFYFKIISFLMKFLLHYLLATN